MNEKKKVEKFVQAEDGTWHVPECRRVKKDDGPAMVNSDAYRSGWDGIFGKKPAVGQA